MEEKDLQTRLQPDHLTSDEAKEALEKEAAKMEAKGKEGVKDDDPRLQKEYHFDFEWADHRGRVWKGHFVNKILNIRERQLAGVQRAKFALGMPIESMDDGALGLNAMVAHMQISLKEKPEWAEDLLGLHSVMLIQAIFEEVSAHEETF